MEVKITGLVERSPKLLVWSTSWTWTMPCRMFLPSIMQDLRLLLFVCSCRNTCSPAVRIGCRAEGEQAAGTVIIHENKRRTSTLGSSRLAPARSTVRRRSGDGRLFLPQCAFERTLQRAFQVRGFDDMIKKRKLSMLPGVARKHDIFSNLRYSKRHDLRNPDLE